MSRQDRGDQALNVLGFDSRGALCGPSLLCFEADAAGGGYLVDNDEDFRKLAGRYDQWITIHNAVKVRVPASGFGDC